MRDTLFKKVDYSLGKLIEDIDLGEIGLPDIQRPFVWTPTKVRDLFDSMYKGFPVGYLLFWTNAFNDEIRLIGSNHKQRVPQLLIVDGQQRLTSLYAIIKDRPVINKDYEPQEIHIAFRPRDGRFEVTDAAIRRDPEFIPDISVVFSPNTAIYRYISDFLQRLNATRSLTRDEENHIAAAIDRLVDLRNYPFTSLELSSSVDEQQVADIFVRINSKGVTLNQADFILTLMSVYWDEGRATLEQFCRQSRVPSGALSSPYNPFVEPEPAQLLRVAVALAFRRARLEHVYALLRGKDLETDTYRTDIRDAQFNKLREAQATTLDLDNWHQFFNALRISGFVSGRMISSKNALYYTYAMFLIGRHDFGVPLGDLKRVIARWFFMAALTSRYTGSFETVMEADMARLRSAKSPADFVDTLDKVMQGVLTDDYWATTLPIDLATSTATGPTLNAYHAALCLLGAQELGSEVRVAELLAPYGKGNRSSLERHHLFPKAYLRRLGIDARSEQNQIANMALIDWSENGAIGDQSPAQYFPKIAAKMEPARLKKMRYWYALPDGWENMEYHHFLDVRRQGIAMVIRDAFYRLLPAKIGLSLKDGEENLITA